MSSEVQLSVIVVTYNSEQVVGNCLASVLRANLPLEIWVIDNLSSDGSADLVERDFPQVKLIRNSRNVGFAAATNQGITEAQGRYVMLLNPDAELTLGAAESLCRFLDNHPEAAVAGPRLCYPDGTPQHACFRFPTLLMSFLDFFPLNHRVQNSRLNGRYPSRQDGSSFAVDHPLGACMVVRREAIDQVGLLDDGFFIYCEEVDWCWRMKKAGWQVYCVSEALVVHHEAQSTRQRAPAMFVELHRSRQRLFSKHRSPCFRWASRQLVRMGIIREMFRCRRRRSRAEISAAQYEEWMKSYREVFRM